MINAKLLDLIQIGLISLVLVFIGLLLREIFWLERPKANRARLILLLSLAGLAEVIHQALQLLFYH